MDRQSQGLYDEALVDAVLARCTEVDSGARNVDNILNGSMLPESPKTYWSKWSMDWRSIK